MEGDAFGAVQIDERSLVLLVENGRSLRQHGTPGDRPCSTTALASSDLPAIMERSTRC
jgi:hypothetical protein